MRRFLDARAGAMTGTGKAKGKEKVQSEAARWVIVSYEETESNNLPITAGPPSFVPLRYLLRKPLAIEGTGRRGLHMEADMKALVHSSSLLEVRYTGFLYPYVG